MVILARLAPQRLMERGGQGMSEAAIYVTFSGFFILFYFFVVLKIAAGLLLNKTSAGLFI